MTELFKDRLPLLSNMASVPMRVNGRVFSCCEAAFQAFKAVIAEQPDMVDKFVGINGYDAKKLGRTVPLAPYLDVWEEVKVDIMWKLLLIKVQHPKVRDQLLEAPDDALFENNTWGDTFWGCVEQPDGTMKGDNVLGRLLVSVKQVILTQPLTRNIFETGAAVLVNPVNVVGVQGKGLALQFRKIPGQFAEYKQLCNSGTFSPGDCRLICNNTIACFATKQHYRNPSQIGWIVSGMEQLRHSLDELGCPTVAIPRLGCGNGNLAWEDVKPIILNAMKGYEGSWWLDGTWHNEGLPCPL